VGFFLRVRGAGLKKDFHNSNFARRARAPGIECPSRGLRHLRGATIRRMLDLYGDRSFIVPLLRRNCAVLPRSIPPHCFAARWAAKEAIFKALGPIARPRVGLLSSALRASKAGHHDCE